LSAAHHEREIARLEAWVARLEERARASSRTGSKPPSQDPPKTRARRRAEARATTAVRVAVDDLVYLILRQQPTPGAFISPGRPPALRSP
jgi:hypothetical protein